MSVTKRRVSLGRHRRQCSICAHPRRDEIEADFVSWRSPAAIAEEYGLADRGSVYRHAHALDLFLKRQRNVRAALEKIIERAGEVEVTSATPFRRREIHFNRTCVKSTHHKLQTFEHSHRRNAEKPRRWRTVVVTSLH